MPVPTVASLCHRLGADLAPAPGFSAPLVGISAVHISELLDPTGYLSGGELLLTTGLTLPKNKIGCERYVGRLKEAGLSALAIGLGPVHAAPPAALVAACQRLDLTLLTVPAPTPFQRITKAYWAEVSRSAEQQLKDVLAIQRALVEAAASADPVAGVLRTLARSLDGWSATFSPSGEVEHVHPPGMAEEAERVRAELRRLEGAGVHSAASFSAAATAMIVLPLAVGERVAGYLAVGTARALDPNRRRAVLTAAALLSIDTVRRQRDESAADAAQRCVALLVDLGFVDAAHRLAPKVDAPMPPDDGRVLVVHCRDSDEAASAVRHWWPDVLAVREDRHSAWFLVPAGHPSLERLDGLLAALDPSTIAVVSDVVRADQVRTVRQALTRQLRGLPPGGRNLIAGAGSPYDQRLVDRLNRSLGELPDPLIEGLTAYLRHRGQWEQASRSLGVHRNTLRHRLERCRAVLGLDVDDPDVSAELWLLLRRRGIA
ncbi:PucR family transcriptional regulator ligand-binding domain-containing protein [Planotetraspora sp. GP83]|uniref:helix-turn-helix domain-containing protein n=1 Tax=Planotetraspora sp. GP83 TaxID=3156264 RepID=UPI00351198F1